MIDNENLMRNLCHMEFDLSHVNMSAPGNAGKLGTMLG